MSSIKIIVCILVVTVSANLVVSEQTNTCADEEAYVALCQASDGQPNQEKRSNTKTAVKPSLKRSVKTRSTSGNMCCSKILLMCGLVEWDKKCGKSEEEIKASLNYIIEFHSECHTNGFAVNETYCRQQSPTFAHECQSFVGKFCDGKATSVVNPTAAANPSISSSMATTGKPVGKVNGSQKQYLSVNMTVILILAVIVVFENIH